MHQRSNMILFVEAKKKHKLFWYSTLYCLKTSCCLLSFINTRESCHKATNWPGCIFGLEKNILKKADNYSMFSQTAHQSLRWILVEQMNGTFSSVLPAEWCGGAAILHPLLTSTPCSLSSISSSSICKSFQWAIQRRWAAYLLQHPLRALQSKAKWFLHFTLRCKVVTFLFTKQLQGSALLEHLSISFSLILSWKLMFSHLWNLWNHYL